MTAEIRTPEQFWAWFSNRGIEMGGVLVRPEGPSGCAYLSADHSKAVFFAGERDDQAFELWSRGRKQHADRLRISLENTRLPAIADEKAVKARIRAKAIELQGEEDRKLEHWLVSFAFLGETLRFSFRDEKQSGILYDFVSGLGMNTGSHSSALSFYSNRPGGY